MYWSLPLLVNPYWLFHRARQPLIGSPAHAPARLDSTLGIQPTEKLRKSASCGALPSHFHLGWSVHLRQAIFDSRMSIRSPRTGNLDSNCEPSSWLDISI